MSCDHRAMVNTMTFIAKKIASPRRVRAQLTWAVSPRACVTAAAKRQPTTIFFFGRSTVLCAAPPRPRHGQAAVSTASLLALAVAHGGGEEFHLDGREEKLST